MSRAGVNSSIGDEYQDLVAAHWMVSMLSEPEILEIEIDATSLSPAGCPYSVDDIVISYRNGNKTCCQCKRNHSTRRGWNATSLENELKKAWKQWRDLPNCSICFYSQDNFGKLARLSDNVRIHDNLASFEFNLPGELKREFDLLTSFGIEKNRDGNTLLSPAEETLQFLHHLNFITFPRDVILKVTLGMLRYSTTDAEKAFEEIRNKVGCIARRADFRNRDRLSVNSEGYSVSCDDLRKFLMDRGLRITPLKEEAQLRRDLDLISSIGRIWPRDICGYRIKRKETTALLKLIEKKEAMTLLLGEPGSGKTCILLELLEILEKDEALYPVLVQARDITSDSLGEKDFTDNVARMAEFRHVVVIVDSLDVISIARDTALSGFFLLLSQLKSLNNVSVVASCRTFDYKYDTRLSSLKDTACLIIAPLDYETEIVPMFETLGFEQKEIVIDQQKQLLTNPKMLGMYVDLIQTGGSTDAITWIELCEAYLETFILRDSNLGDEAYEVLKQIAARMLEKRRLDITKLEVNIPCELARHLMSTNILVETERGNYTFGHQSLVDLLCVAQAMESGASMLEFIQSMKPVPFIRPTIRAFFFYLRSHDPKSFRQQVRALLNSQTIAFHLKRLIVMSLAEIKPIDADWPLVLDLLREHTTLFGCFFSVIDIVVWFDFIEKFLIPEWSTNDEQRWQFLYLEQLSKCSEMEQTLIAKKWCLALHSDVIDQTETVRRASIALRGMVQLETVELRDVFISIIENPDKEFYSLLATPLCKWINATDSNEDILWRYITRDVNDADLDKLEETLHCEGHYLENSNFLERRMIASENFLSLVIDSIQTWSRKLTVTRDFSAVDSHFLQKTSYQRKRSKYSLHHVGFLNVIFLALEKSCIDHAMRDSDWWMSHAETLANSEEAALRYIALLCLTEVPNNNIALVRHILHDIKWNDVHPFKYEVARLLGTSAPYLCNEDLEALQRTICRHYEDVAEEDIGWFLKIKRDILLEIPAPYRTVESQKIIDTANRFFGNSDRKPPVTSWAGIIFSPVTCDQFLSFKNSSVLRIIQHYDTRSNRVDDFQGDFGVGGPVEVAHQLSEAVSKNPARFLPWGEEVWSVIAPIFRNAILSGASRHVKYCFGNLKPPSDWKPVCTPDAEFLLSQLFSIFDKCPCEGLENTLIGVLEACSNIVVEKADVEHICENLVMFASSPDPSLKDWDKDDVLGTGLACTRGIAASATGVMANRWLEKNHEELPQLLVELLQQFASDAHPSVRSMILIHLPYFIGKYPKIGWDLFDACVSITPAVVWENVYECLYYFYYHSFDRVQKYLSMMEKSAMPEAGKSWGMLMTLGYLSNKMSFSELNSALIRVNEESAWVGVAEIFSHNITDHTVRDKCLQGLEHLLKNAPATDDIFYSVASVFNDEGSKYTSLSMSLIEAYFTYVTRIPNRKRISMYNFPDWLNGICQEESDLALFAAETLLEKVMDTDLDIRANEKFTNLLTCLFREAEEREETDGGNMLQRVIVLQNSLLEKGVSNIENWLREAERP